MPNADPHQIPSAQPSSDFAANDVPSSCSAVYAYFEILAFALICGAADALLTGKSWYVWVPAFACGTLFFLIGTKSPWIRSKFVSVDWVIWAKRMDRALRVSAVLAVVSLVASGYFFYREASHLWRDVVRRSQADYRDHSPESPRASTTPDSRNEPADGVPTAQSPPPINHVDWHNKHNWRGNLRIGMTETEVYRLFGDPGQIQVSGNLEIWHYGYGEITFTDGTLYSYTEPE